MSNDTETLTLTEFLLARIAEDEAVAREALEHDDVPGRWNAADFFDDGISIWSTAEGGQVMSETGDEPPLRHVIRFDPTRVLAECEAKRRIVAEHGIECWPDEGGGDWYGCETCPTETVPHPSEVRCPTLRILASLYADHADYRDEWKP